MAAILILASCPVSAPAEGPVTAVQEALRKEQLLPDQPSGRLDEPTRAALRQYQTQRGLPVTGEIDNATMEALEAGAGPKAAQTVVPGVPTETVRGDREFLNKIGGNGGGTGSGTTVATEDAAPSAAPAQKRRHIATRKSEVATIAQGGTLERKTRGSSPRHQDQATTQPQGNDIAVGTTMERTRSQQKTATANETGGYEGETSEDSRPKDNGFFHRLFHRDE